MINSIKLPRVSPQRWTWKLLFFRKSTSTAEEWTSLKSKLAAHGYKFFEGSTSDRNQFVILAWDSDEVTLDGEAIELNVRDAFDFGTTCDAEGLRKPVVGRFKAKSFDFWVVGVHLKSRSGSGASQPRSVKRSAKTWWPRLMTL